MTFIVSLAGLVLSAIAMKEAGEEGKTGQAYFFGALVVVNLGMMIVNIALSGGGA